MAKLVISVNVQKLLDFLLDIPTQAGRFRGLLSPLGQLQEWFWTSTRRILAWYKMLPLFDFACK